MDRAKLDRLHDLSGRVAIITGGTRGIGRAIAEGFGAAGATVVVASRKADACDEMVAHLEQMGVEALGVPTHMGDLDAIANLVEGTVAAFGRIDIVVNGAANALALPLGQLTESGLGQVTRHQSPRPSVPGRASASRTSKPPGMPPS